jgi:tRNA dimethylallyltransferase
MAPLVVIVGPTASGKSATALEVAERHNGEIICADSRTIYKYMDIGTAKPSKADQSRVPHWGIDLVEPGDLFTASDFQAYARLKIDEIRARGRLPILVGGSGLYIDAVILDYEFGLAADKVFRGHLETMTIEQLHAYCAKQNVVQPENRLNKRYLIRAIEQQTINTKRRDQPSPKTLVVGIATERDVLRERITTRAEHLFAQGMIEEAIALGQRYGWESEAMTGNIYKLVRQFERGDISEADLKQEFVTADWQLAKRQLTWLRRHYFITWLPAGQIAEFIDSRLAQMNNS